MHFDFRLSSANAQILRVTHLSEAKAGLAQDDNSREISPCDTLPSITPNPLSS
jgi:hypothetical protein